MRHCQHIKQVEDDAFWPGAGEGKADNSGIDFHAIKRDCCVEAGSERAWSYVGRHQDKFEVDINKLPAHAKKKLGSRKFRGFKSFKVPRFRAYKIEGFNREADDFWENGEDRVYLKMCCKGKKRFWE